MDVSIIIVNYNTKEITLDCISSIYKFTSGSEFEIIIVDNASIDGSQEAIKNTFPNLLLIENEENIGFGSANNIGSKYAKGEFLFFLNSDTILFEDSISKMIAFFKKEETNIKIGTLGCILVNKNKQVNGVGGEFPTCDKEIRHYKSLIPGLNFFYPKSRQKKIPIEKKYFEIDYVIGADLLIRSYVFRKLNGFDSDYFMYYEESDLQKRMRKLNLKAWIYTDTKIIHLEDGTGKTIKKYSNQKRKIIHTSKNIYLKKNDADNYNKYLLWDKFYLLLNRLNRKYSRIENSDYIKEIKITHK